jgi:hypothetical protein
MFLESQDDRSRMKAAARQAACRRDLPSGAGAGPLAAIAARRTAALRFSARIPTRSPGSGSTPSKIADQLSAVIRPSATGDQGRSGERP